MEIAFRNVSKVYAVRSGGTLRQTAGGVATPSNETSEVAFFERDALPPMSLGRTLPKQVARMFEHWEHPELPTEFD